MEHLHHRIAERAYFMWLDAGCIHGLDRVHWFAAAKIELRSASARKGHETRKANAKRSTLAKTCGNFAPRIEARA